MPLWGLRRIKSKLPVAWATFAVIKFSQRALNLSSPTFWHTSRKANQKIFFLHLFLLFPWRFQNDLNFTRKRSTNTFTERRKESKLELARMLFIFRAANGSRSAGRSGLAGWLAATIIWQHVACLNTWWIFLFGGRKRPGWANISTWIQETNKKLESSSLPIPLKKVIARNNYAAPAHFAFNLFFHQN